MGRSTILYRKGKGSHDTRDSVLYSYRKHPKICWDGTTVAEGSQQTKKYISQKITSELSEGKGNKNISYKMMARC
jgi:hypothetical protein